MISNASEQFLKEFAFVKKTQAKIILEADDAGPSIRASGVPIVRMQAMSSDAAHNERNIGQIRAHSWRFLKRARDEQLQE